MWARGNRGGAGRAPYGIDSLLLDPLSALDPKPARSCRHADPAGAGRQIIVFANEPAPNAPGISQTALAPA
jgi:hypothetical protein